MNLFAVGIRLDRARSELLQPVLADVAAAFPVLASGRRHFWASECGTIAVASQVPEPGWSGPRNYVADTADMFSLFDGLPIDPSGSCKAHDAADLGKCWETAVSDLDGFFCCLRIDKAALTAELQLDSFGTYPVFYWNEGDALLISNSVAVLDRITRSTALDPEGVSRMLTMGWVAGDRTLRAGVRAFPAGQRWTWSAASGQAKTASSYGYRDLAGVRKTPLTRQRIAELADGLGRQLRVIGDNFDNVHCPLTGGKDSRVIAALLASNDIDVHFYTYGNRVGRDSEIAGQVADALGIEHESVLTETSSLLANWDKEVESFVFQGDGMCPLQLIVGAISARKVAAPPMPVRLWGAGGEIGRAYHFNPLRAMQRDSVAGMKRTVRRRWLGDCDGLMRPGVYASAASFIGDSIDRYADAGFGTSDLADVFFLYQRGGRRVGKNLRANMSLRDSYSPFFTRQFVEVAFSLGESERRTEPLHHDLLAAMAPEALAIPFDKGGWSSRSATVNRYQELTRVVYGRIARNLQGRFGVGGSSKPDNILVKDTNFERTAWLDRLQETFRQMCLDESQGEIWNYVDKNKFATVTSGRRNARSIAHNAKALFLIATLYFYDRQSKLS